MFGRQDVKADLPFVFVKNSKDLKIGDRLRVTGYPTNVRIVAPRLTLSSGFVAAFEVGLKEDRTDWVVADVEVGPGSSGGGFFNSEYHLVAICTAGQKGQPAVSFGVPTERLPNEWLEIIRKGGGRSPPP